MLVRRVDPEEPLSIKLNNRIGGQPSHITICQRRSAKFGLLSQAILKLILLTKLILGDEVVKVYQLNWDQFLVGAEPGKLLLSRLEVTLQMEIHRNGGDDAFELKRMNGMADVADDGVAPVHERDFFILRESCGVGLFEQDGLGKDDFFGTEGIILGVYRFHFGVGCFTGSCERDGDFVGFGNGRVARCDGVDVFLVCGPELGPFEVDNVL